MFQSIMRNLGPNCSTRCLDGKKSSAVKCKTTGQLSGGLNCLINILSLKHADVTVAQWAIKRDKSLELFSQRT